MKITNTRKINERIKQYIDRQELNALIGMNVGETFSQNLKFENPRELETFAQDFRDDLARDGLEISKDESIIASMLLTVINEKMGGVQDFPQKVFFDIVFNSMVFHRGSFGENAYLNNISFEEATMGRFTIKTNTYSKYEAFHYSIPTFSPDGYMIPLIGTFRYRFKYPAIEEDGVTWMSVTPNEIITMERPIEEAHGKVLTLGCGMGYYAYMAALKENVDHVTIVERQQEVIDLFEKYILPQFECREKITIIKADACEYMKTLSDGEFDYCFADLWLGNNDLIQYIKLKSTCGHFSNMTMNYWIEGSLVFSLMEYVETVIFDEYYKNQNMQSEIPNDISKEDEQILDYIKRLLEDEEINTLEDVDRYMNYQTILDLMENKGIYMC